MSWRLGVVAVLSGLALGGGALVPWLWPTSLIAFAGISYLLYQTAGDRLRWRLMCGVGLVTYGLTFAAMFWHTLPLDWLGVSGVTGPLLIFLLWGVTVGVFASVFAFGFTLGARALRGVWFDGVTIASVYVLVEVVGAYLYSLVMYAPSALVGPHFTMGSPGYLLAESAWLLPFAGVGGLYGLLALQAGIGCMVYWLFVRTPRELLRGAVVAAVLGLAIAGPSWSLYAGTPALAPLPVAAVTLFEDNLGDTPVVAAVRAQLAAAAATTGVVFMPEDTRYFTEENLLELAKLRRTFPDVAVVTSAASYQPQGLVSEIMYVELGTGYRATSSKQFLMIFGEYMPWLFNVLGRVLGQGALLDSIAASRGYVLEPTVPLAPERGFVGGVGLCSDAMSPVLYRDQVRHGAAYVANLASHRWFYESRPLYRTAVRVGAVRAAELDRWYVRASNDTPSFLLDNRGRLVAETTWGANEPLVATLFLRDSHTLYATVGLGILSLPLVWLLHVFCYLGRRGRVRRETVEP